MGEGGEGNKKHSRRERNKTQVGFTDQLYENDLKLHSARKGAVRERHHKLQPGERETKHKFAHVNASFH